MDRAPIWDDLTTFDGEPWRDRVDLVTAGIPCQPFSVAGERRGIHDPRWLWPDLWRVIGESGARALFLENTPRIRTAALPIILADLAESGWSAEWGLLRASDVGAPHQRNRFFLLAYADGNGLEEFGGGSVFDSLGTTLGDDTDRRHEGMADTDEPGLEGTQPAGRRHLPAGSGEELAHADEPGRDGRTGEIDQAGGWGQPADSSHAFPPGRDDDDGWRRWLDAGGPAPAVRRDSHGTAYRMDRLRCLGNAVVPLQAAHAFRQLSERHLSR